MRAGRHILIDVRKVMTKGQFKVIQVWEHLAYHHVRYPITFCSAFLPALVFIQRSTTNQIQLLFADQSVLTAATTSLGSAHPRLYKRQLPDSNQEIISELQPVISDIQRASTLGPEQWVFGVIGTTLHQGWLPWPSSGHAQLTGQLAASTCQWPYPTYWVTGAPATRRLSDVRAPRLGS
jgi:hypothetical protein